VVVHGLSGLGSGPGETCPRGCTRGFANAAATMSGALPRLGRRNQKPLSSLRCRIAGGPAGVPAARLAAVTHAESLRSAAAEPSRSTSLRAGSPRRAPVAAG